MSAEGSLRFEAPAKVNFGLHVLARRGDGFHEIDTIMAKLELADVLSVKPAEAGVELAIEQPEGPGFAEKLPTDETNLAVKAVRAYLDAIGRNAGVRMHLLKRVPIAAGLGGGSADAAAALRAVASLFPAAVDLAALGKELGSDVPFFLQGAPAARARGRGEKLEPLDLPRRSLVLVNPGVPVSAAEAYAELQTFTPRLDPAQILGDLAANAEPSLRNALQSGVMLAHPEVRDALLALREHELEGVVMSGSGATCFGIARDADHAQEVAEAIAAERPEWWVTATRTRSADPAEGDDLSGS